MPAMPRLKGKATKVAYAILGKPDSMIYKPTKRQKRRNERLNQMDTTYYR